MKSKKELPQFVKDLLSCPPRRGGGLNNWLFRTALVFHPYRSQEEIVQLLAAATYGEPIQYGEIERAVKNSASVAWEPGKQVFRPAGPKWPPINQEQREAVLATGYNSEVLRESSPVKFTDDLPHTDEIVDALFPGNPLLCVGKTGWEFATHSREEWRGLLTERQFIVPSPMSSKTGRTKDGKESEHTLDNTGPRRFLVIEQDQGTADEQSAVILHLAEKAPLALAVHSGNESIHGWFYCEGQPEDRLKRFMLGAVSLGADPSTWTRSQFVRMPDGLHNNGNRQVVLFFNPEVIKSCQH